MGISFCLQQTTAVLSGPLYQVKNEVLSAECSSPAVFVFKTGSKKFSHYATPNDMDQWPDSYEEATLTGVSFYRQACVVREWAKVSLMREDLRFTLGALKRLACELNELHGELIIDRTTNITGA